MVTRTFLTKSNTIIKGTKENFGLNPICMLHYGDMLSRFIINFDVTNLKNEYMSMTNVDEVTHFLKMTNCGSVNNSLAETINGFNGATERKRAVSFDVIAFKVPQAWDEGVGFDSRLDFWVNGEAIVDANASTWYKSSNATSWECGGIYSLETLEVEYEKYLQGEKSIIVARQHFDHGNENLSLNITDYIKEIINGGENHGLCIAFAPDYENVFTEKVNYVGFFNMHTNTIFAPCIETRWNNTILDNRYDFTLNRKNRLYLYSQIGGSLKNLDKLPKCHIENEEYVVKQSKKGVYYVEIDASTENFTSESIYYDIWSEIVYNGVVFDDVEMEFVVNPHESFFKIGKKDSAINKINIMVQGVNDMETLNRGEQREVEVYFKQSYTHGEYRLLDDVEYRVTLIYSRNSS